MRIDKKDKAELVNILLDIEIYIKRIINWILDQKEDPYNIKSETITKLVKAISESGKIDKKLRYYVMLYNFSRISIYSYVKFQFCSEENNLLNPLPDYPLDHMSMMIPENVKMIYLINRGKFIFYFERMGKLLHSNIFSDICGRFDYL